MEITRNVTEIAANDKLALEHLLGQTLLDGQQIVVRVVSHGTLPTNEASPTNGLHAETEDETLPEWCNVFKGLSDAEVAAIEEVMLSRADLTRPAQFAG